ncbi:MAG: hypothetical protein ACLSB9_35560 [Hydrogeniiclostridium mannosilyticum]
MEEQKLIQMIRFDHDLVVFIEGSDDQQRQVNIYGYAMHQAVNVWDFVEWLCTRKMRAVFAGNPYAFPDIVNWLGGEALCDPGQLYPDTQGPASSLECGGWRNRLETAVLNTFFLMTANAAAM